MKHVDEAFTGKLQAIINLQTELQLEEHKYTSLKRANKSHEIFKQTQLRIKRLKMQLKEKEADALTLFK